MGKAEEEGQADLNLYHVYRHNFGTALVGYLQRSDRESCIELLESVPSEKTLYKKILHYMLAEDNPNCIRAIIEALSYYYPALPPLHHAAKEAAHSLVQLFLDYGQDPNIRVDYAPRHLKQALPLEFALSNLREKFFYNWDDCVFRLLCLFCARQKRQFLETARVLALQTKELDQDILKYVKEGQVEYLCALMLLGYHMRIPSVECFEGDEFTKQQMLQLVDIFQRIGDKLQVYVRLPRAECKMRPQRVVSDIASLFRDADLPVKSIDTIMHSFPDWLKTVGEENGSIIEVNRQYLSKNIHGVQDLNGSHNMPYNLTQGCRFLHTKVHKPGSGHSSAFKDPGYVVSKLSPFRKNCSFWMMALRRAIRHI